MSVRLAAAAILLTIPGPTAEARAAPACAIQDDKVFAGDQEHVRLARRSDLAAAANLAVFRARMAVNTDGAPTSYHPEDFEGARLAINKIVHGITITRAGGGTLTNAQKKNVFDAWRNSPGWAVPPGYSISWQSVIAKDAAGRPCIFRSGEHRGYFGSLTATKQGLPASQWGECQVRNQLDLRHVPAIVLRGPSVSPLSTFGARKGDLVLAINPATTPATIVPAIIGDTGNPKRIGEGSVALNMRLLGITAQPRTYSEAVRLDTGNRQMIVAVLPRTENYRPARPYTDANIAERVKAWAQDRGYGSLADLAAAAAACAEGL